MISLALMIDIIIFISIFLILEQYSTTCQDDFKPVLRELLATHPGLEFLQSTPEFQERYGLYFLGITLHLEVHVIVD